MPFGAILSQEIGSFALFTLAVRYAGEGAWRAGYPPLTLQAAAGAARVMTDSKRFADEVRVLPIAPVRRIDIRV